MTEVRLVRWGPEDRPLLDRLLGDAEMTKYVGGPESQEKLDDRQTRYEAADALSYKIVLPEGDAGWVGLWETTWHDEQAWETGWFVVPEFQGRGVAAAAASLVIDLARAEGRFRYLYAVPSIHNAPSNAICRKLGFELLGECDFEYPPGSTMRGNDWRFDLHAGQRTFD